MSTSTESKARQAEVNAARRVSGGGDRYYKGFGEPGAALAAWLIRQGLDPHEDFLARYCPAERRWFFWQREEE